VIGDTDPPKAAKLVKGPQADHLLALVGLER
jgi:endonuclease-3